MNQLFNRPSAAKASGGFFLLVLKIVNSYN
jgi:hypothetical protein